MEDKPDKPKRIPKPPMTEETRFVVEKLLPMLGEDVETLSEKELLRLARPAIDAAVGYQEVGEETPGHLRGLDVENVRETLIWAQKMIRGEEDVRAWVADATGIIRTIVDAWDRKRRLYGIGIPGRSLEKFASRWAPIIRAYWVNAVARSLTWKRPDEPANGNFYFTACPKCRKIFAKANARQYWCSDSCRGSQSK